MLVKVGVNVAVGGGVVSVGVGGDGVTVIVGEADGTSVVLGSGACLRVAEVGLHPLTLLKYEKGRCPIPADAIQCIERVLERQTSDRELIRTEVSERPCAFIPDLFEMEREAAARLLALW